MVWSSDFVPVHATWDDFDEVLIEDLGQYSEDFGPIFPRAINLLGDVAGYVVTDDGDRAFRLPASGDWEFDDIVVFPKLNEDNDRVRAEAINAFGEITGTSARMAGITFDYPNRAFLFRPNGDMLDLGVLRNDGRGHSYGNDINDWGDVVGRATGKGWDIYAFRWQDGVMQALAGRDALDAYGINNLGVVIGQVRHRDDSLQPFVYFDDHGMLDLVDLVSSGPNSSIFKMQLTTKDGTEPPGSLGLANNTSSSVYSPAMCLIRRISRRREPNPPEDGTKLPQPLLSDEKEIAGWKR